MDDPAVRLVCFPHAGGAASTFHGWSQQLGPNVELLAVQYPGRQERLGDPVIESIEELADQIAGELVTFLDRPLALFGHSMGAAVAHEVARQLEDRYGEALVRLFVSGRSAPDSGAGGTLLPQDDDLSDVDDDEALIAWAQGQDAAVSAAYEVPELRELLLPSLRADLRALAVYRPKHRAPLRTPITACGGDTDPGCAPTNLSSWQEATAGGFSTRIFPGDHFYLLSNPAGLISEICSGILN
ncbi:thioesterase II family protein (plasmid) [Streptomyces sp. AHU1]|uniref:thioesterase II family protein n=1 Tax=Streptomyces sp. AHU1 TaxID=3377215 RepID=UPI003877C282